MTKNMKKSPNFLMMVSVVVMFSALSGTDAFAGCQLNVYVKNISKESLNVKNGVLFGDDSSVKIKLGTWRNLNTGGWFIDKDEFSLDSGQKNGDGFRADFNCGAKRRYKVRYICQGGKYEGSLFTDYYPSAKGWTEKQSVTVNLGRCK